MIERHLAPGAKMNEPRPAPAAIVGKVQASCAGTEKDSGRIMGIGSEAADVTTLWSHRLPLLRLHSEWNKKAGNQELPNWRE